MRGRLEIPFAEVLRKHLRRKRRQKSPRKHSPRKSCQQSSRRTRGRSAKARRRTFPSFNQTKLPIFSTAHMGLTALQARLYVFGIVFTQLAQGAPRAEAQNNEAENQRSEGRGVRSASLVTGVLRHSARLDDYSALEWDLPRALACWARGYRSEKPQSCLNSRFAQHTALGI